MATTEQSVEALYATGHWLLTGNRFSDAAIVFRAMALAAPSDERSWLALGSCHEGIGQLRIATSLYEIAGEVAAPAIRCTIARARSLRALGHEDEAIQALERAQELASEHGEDDLLAMAEHELRGAS
jgi:tetratricopeptide (TPR) repeat protein